MQHKQKTVIIIAALVVVVAIIAFVWPQLGGKNANSAGGPGLPDGDDVVAVVNGTEITKNDLYQAMFERYGEQAIDQLITEILIEQEAERHNIQVGDDEIEAEIDAMAGQYGGRETLEMLLSQSGSSLEAFKRDIRLNLYVERILADEIEVTDDEVREYYENNQDLYEQEEQIKARHILVEDSALARELLTQLRNGADFAELAEKHSTDTVSAANGGDLGWFPRGQMVEPFEEAAFSAEIGEIVGPVETEHGYHLIEVLDHREAGVQPFDEVEDEIRESLRAQKLQEKALTWLQDIRASADIQRNE